MAIENHNNDDNLLDNELPKDGDSNADLISIRQSTYKRTVNEMKNLKAKHADAIAKLAEIEARDRQQEEARLRADKQYEELLKKKDEELSLTRSELERTNKDITDFRKTSAFLSAMGNAKIESKYYNLIPIDNIKLDDQGQIDQDSLVNSVNMFRQEHPRLIVEQRSDLPANKPGTSNGTKLTVSQWKALGSSAEMRKRFHEVDFSTK